MKEKRSGGNPTRTSAFATGNPSGEKSISTSSRKPLTIRPTRPTASSRRNRRRNEERSSGLPYGLDCLVKTRPGDLEGVERSVRIVELPGLDTGEDIGDWFAKGHDRDELKKLRVSPPSRTGDHSFITVHSVAELADPEPPKYAVADLIFEETFVIMGGDPRAGKATLCLHPALGFLVGHRVFGQHEVLKPVPVVFVECDMGEKHFQGAVKQAAVVCGVDELQHPFHA